MRFSNLMVTATTSVVLVAVALSADAQQARSGAWTLNTPEGEWHMTGRDYGLQRFSPLKQITTSNVAELRPVWSFSTGTLRGQEGNPLVIGNVMYVHTSFPNIVYALDLAKPGAPMIWKHVPNQSPDAIPIACCDLVNRGTAYHPSGMIFIQLLQGELLALDAKTGKELWKVKNADYKQGSTMTNAPIVIKDIVIAGISGGEFGVRGRVTAYHVKTGKELWRAYSTGSDSDVLIEGDANPHYPSHRGKDLGVSTWQGDEWKRGGGTTWGWYSYDPELNLFYYSTGNPGTWNPDQRPGDNKWSMTIFARNPDNGKVKWAYQMTPHDEWDYDGVNENILAEISVQGKPTKVLVHFDRNGFAYTLDRTNGKLLVAQPFGPVNWAKRVDLTTGVPEKDPKYGTTSKKNTEGICPAAIGFKDQQPAAYSPITGLFYVPANHICMDYEGVEVKYTAGQPYVGAIIRMFPGPGGHRGNFIAWDASRGKAVWSNKENLAAYGGALTTAGGLVFYGTMEGWLKALDQKTGKSLWQYKTPSGIIGNPMTYNGPDGQQYVAVLSGIGGWAGIGVAAGIGAEDPTAGLGALGAFGDAGNFSNQGGVLTVFALTDPWAPADLGLVPQLPIPPTPTSTYIVPRRLLGGTGKETLGYVFDRIRYAFTRAGIEEWSVHAIGNQGFAVVSRLESIDEDGMAKPGAERWMIEEPNDKSFSLGKYFRALFKANPGRYRLILLAVTTKGLRTGPAIDSPLTMHLLLSSGAHRLDELHNKTLGKSWRCEALIYEFYRPTEDDPARWVGAGQSHLMPTQHLAGAGLWAREELQRDD